MTESQYIRVYLTNLKYAKMHDLKAIYCKVEQTLKKLTKEYFEYGGNTQFYPNKPKMTDLEVIALSITAECVQIDSENLLWSKLKKDYPQLIKDLPHRTKFNKRRKRLTETMSDCLRIISDLICESFETNTLIIDSMPIPTCRIVREKTSKACRNPILDEVQADKGMNVILGGWYIGYKFHLITNDAGVYRDLMVSGASVHDNYYLKQLDSDHGHLRGFELLGDRGYIGKVTQLKLFEDLNLTLSVPYRRNQKDFKEYDFGKKIKRKTIEVCFSQFVDEFNIRRNYAKRFDGFFTRIVTKVIAKTFKQLINLQNKKPINQTKHALAT